MVAILEDLGCQTEQTWVETWASWRFALLFKISISLLASCQLSFHFFLHHSPFRIHLLTHHPQVFFVFFSSWHSVIFFPLSFECVLSLSSSRSAVAYLTLSSYHFRRCECTKKKNTASHLGMSFTYGNTHFTHRTWQLEAIKALPESRQHKRHVTSHLVQSLSPWRHLSSASPSPCHHYRQLSL